MAITSNDINNQRFSIDRKGYDVDEVDVFLEYVADELDGMNAQIAELTEQGGNGSSAAVVAQPQGDLAELEAKIDEQEKIIDEKEELVSKLEADLAEQASHLADLETQLDAALAQASIAETHEEPQPEGPTQADIDERDARIEKLEREAAARDVAMANDLRARNTRIAELENRIAEMDNASMATRDENSARVLELEGKITQMEVSSRVDLDSRDAQIATLKAKIVNLESEAKNNVEKDVRIASLEKRLEEAENESRAISQALVVAQQSADEIIEKSERKAEEIVDQARSEAEAIRQRAQEEKQKLIDSAAEYREKRNDAQDEFRATLEEIIEEANSKLSTLTSDIERRIKSEREMRRESLSSQQYQPVSQGATQMWGAEAARYASPQQAPIMAIPNGYQYVSNYATPVSDAIAVNPVQVSPTGVEKDMSGYGDTGVYDFDDID